MRRLNEIDLSVSLSFFFELEPKERESRLGLKILTADKLRWEAPWIIERFAAESTLYS